MDVDALLARVGDVGTRRAFGEPIERGDTIVVPVAIVASGSGGGGDATDGGAGGGGVAWPLGAYVIRDGAVRWIPAIDATRIALAALAVVRVLVAARGARRRGGP